MKNKVLRISSLVSFFITVITVAWKVSQNHNQPEFPRLFSGVSELILVFVIISGLFFTWLFMETWRSSRIKKWLKIILKSTRWFWIVSGLLAYLIYESLQNLLFINAGLPEVYYPVLLVENYYLFVWLLGLSGVNLTAWLVAGYFQEHFAFGKESKKIGFIFLVTAGMLIIQIGGMGSLPINAPLPMLQVLVVSAAVIAGGLVLEKIAKLSPGLKSILAWDGLVFLLLWAAAYFLWAGVPLQSNYFLEAPREPNYQFAPASDAVYYEIQAQRLLAGEGFEAKVQHPFYNFLLAGFHLLGGSGFEDVFRIQIALLALTPFILYKIGGLFGGRLTGWLLAGFFMIREYNALRLGSRITVSNVQVLMTEPVTMLGVALFLYIILKWLIRNPDQKSPAFLLGGVTGLIVLIRVEMLSLVGVFILGSLFVFRKRLYHWLRISLIFLFTITLVLAPWMIRNYHQTGRLSIDKSQVARRITARLSSAVPGKLVTEGSAENGPEIGYFNNLSKLGIRTGERLITSLQQAVVYLPSNHLPLGGLDNFVRVVPEKGRIFLFQNGPFSAEYLTMYIKSLPYWKAGWGGDIAPRSYLPIFLVLLTLGWGFQSAWKRHKGLSVLPLLVLLFHSLTYALYNKAGGRHIQVADWVMLIYFSVGILRVLEFVLTRLGKPGMDLDRKEKKNRLEGMKIRKASLKWDWIWGGVIAAVALAMPVVEQVIPTRYTETRLEEFFAVELIPDDREYVMGRVLYPNFYLTEDVFEDDRGGRMPESGIQQMVFYLVGTRNIWVSLPAEAARADIQHYDEVILAGELLRDSDQDLAQKQLPYFQAEQVYQLER